MMNKTYTQDRRTCFRTPTGFHDKAQGKRSAALGKRGSKSSTPTGLHKKPRRRSINPFQGLARKASRTQGGASLTLGFGIEPRWGSRTEARRMRVHAPTAAQQCHSGDADAVSTVRGDGNDVAFVERPEMTEGRP